MTNETRWGTAGLAETHRCPVPSPPCRWDVEVALTEDAPPRFGAFLRTQRVTHFDASAFGLPAPEAAMMDPQQRLLLELGWEALQGAAAAAGTAVGTSSADVGVYVGISTPDYADLKKAHSPIGVYSATGQWVRRGAASMCVLYVDSMYPCATASAISAAIGFHSRVSWCVWLGNTYRGCLPCRHSGGVALSVVSLRCVADPTRCLSLLPAQALP